MTRSEVLNAINEYIFSQEKRYILKRRLLDDATFERIAEEMDVTANCVKKRYADAYKKLEPHLRSAISA